jgi:hypothetical protein
VVGGGGGGEREREREREVAMDPEIYRDIGRTQDHKIQSVYSDHEYMARGYMQAMS